MDNQFAIQLFEQQQVRIVWDAEVEKYYFSIVDVVQILTDSADATAYWRKLKQRLKAEGNETVTNCHAWNWHSIHWQRRLPQRFLALVTQRQWLKINKWRKAAVKQPKLLA